MNNDGYNAVVMRIDNIVKHPNADKLQVINLGGIQVVTGLTAKINDLAIYFKEKTQIAEWFLKERNLYRHKDKNNDKDSAPGFFEDNGVVRSLRLRGIYSQGFIYFPTQDEIINWNLKENTLINEVNNLELCWKFETFVFHEDKKQPNKVFVKRKKDKFHEEFVRYGNTSSIVDVINTIPVGSGILVTNKLHGTSGRTGKFAVNAKWSWRHPMKSFSNWWNNVKEFNILTGSRNQNLYNNEDIFGKDFRFAIHKQFIALKDLMYEKEIFFYEIVGWNGSTPIQQLDANMFHYGQQRGTFTFYVYAISQDNKRLTYDEVVTRCNSLKLNVVPVLDAFVFSSKTDLIDRLYEYDKLYSNADILGKTHISEGVVLNISPPGLQSYKAKYKFTKFCELENINTYAGKLDIESVS